MNKTEIAKLSTKELVAAYNKATGKSIKKFSSRAAGERQVLALIKPATAKTVRGAAGGKNGRPKISFSVKLNEDASESKPHANSARMKLIEWLRQCTGQKATIDEIEAHFKRPMRGIVQKLVEKKWLDR